MSAWIPAPPLESVSYTHLDVYKRQDQESVIYRLRQTALAQHHRDVDRLVFGPRLDDDVDAVLVLLGDDVDAGGSVSGRRLAVCPDVIRCV